MEIVVTSGQNHLNPLCFQVGLFSYVVDLVLEVRYFINCMSTKLELSLLYHVRVAVYAGLETFEFLLFVCKPCFV